MQTALFKSHQTLSAKFTDFAGWEMPLQYEGILQEHKAVREDVGLFDVSHMGLIEINGPDTLTYLDFLSTNTILNKPFGSIVYTVFCDENGGSIDDLLIYIESNEKGYVVVNASNRAKDLQHMQAIAPRYQVEITDRYSDYGILSLQGPKSADLLKSLYPELPALPPMHFTQLPKERGLLSRSGYTGETGFEFYVPLENIQSLWEKLLDQGRSFGIKPCGLAVRDLLRLEMGYALYGHELTPAIAPTESVAAWTVKKDGRNFLGKIALDKLERKGTKRSAVALKGIERAPAREGYPVYMDDALIGHITSGTFSPGLQKPIALALIERKLTKGVQVQVKVRDTMFPFQVVKLPFITR